MRSKRRAERVSWARIEKARHEREKDGKPYKIVREAGWFAIVQQNRVTAFVQRPVKGANGKWSSTRKRLLIIETPEDIERAREAAKRTGALTPRSAMTLRQALEEYIERDLGREDHSPRTPVVYRRALARSPWADAPINRLPSRRDVNNWHSAQESKIAANMTVVVSRIACKYAKTQIDDTITVNPFTEIKRHKPKPPKKAMTADEIRQWWIDVEKVKNPIKRTLHKVMLLTALRSEDARTMRWTDVDFQTMTIHRPNPKGGAKRAFTLPMTKTVADLLRELQGLSHTWVFPSRTGGVMANALGERCLSHTSHALRHTFSTQALNAGVSWHVLQYLLNHKPPGSTGVYIDPTQLPILMREAIEKAEHALLAS